MKNEIKWVFIPPEQRASLPENKGIYCFVVKSGETKNYIYIGQSGRIKERVYSHRNLIKEIAKELLDSEEVLIGYFLCEKQTSMEYRAIRQFNPRNNFYCTGVFENSRSKAGDDLIKALDGRTLLWARKEFKIPYLGQKINGKMKFTEEEIERINKRLSSNIKLN